MTIIPPDKLPTPQELWDSIEVFERLGAIEDDADYAPDGVFTTTVDEFVEEAVRAVGRVPLDRPEDRRTIVYALLEQLGLLPAYRRDPICLQCTLPFDARGGRDGSEVDTLCPWCEERQMAERRSRLDRVFEMLTAMIPRRPGRPKDKPLELERVVEACVAVLENGSEPTREAAHDQLRADYVISVQFSTFENHKLPKLYRSYGLDGWSDIVELARMTLQEQPARLDMFDKDRI